MRSRSGITAAHSVLTLLLIVAAIPTLMPPTPDGGQAGPRSAQQTDQGKGRKQALPMTDYLAPAPLDPKEQARRHARGSRYDNRDSQAIGETSPGVTGSVTRTHWWLKMPALPVPQSGAVVIGTVVDASAYLSNDKTSLYSEFSIDVESVLQNTSERSLSPGDLTIAEREGGATRLPSGRIFQHRVGSQDMPQNGHRYVLFLEYNPPGSDFLIRTAYELRNGRTFALDRGDSSVSGRRVPLKFEDFDNTPEGEFLDIVRKEIRKGGKTNE
jgi:hypothetical protein